MKSNNENSSRIDYGIVLCILILAIIGLVSLYSTTVLIQDGSIRMTIMQLIWYIVGISTAAVIMLFDSEQLWKITDYLYGDCCFSSYALLYDRSLAASTRQKVGLKSR